MAILLSLGTVSFAQDGLVTETPEATPAVVDVEAPAPDTELSLAARLVNSLESRDTTQVVIVLALIVVFALIQIIKIWKGEQDPVATLADTIHKLTTPGGTAQIQQELNAGTRQLVEGAVQTGVDSIEGLILTLTDSQRAAIAHAVMTLSTATEYAENKPDLVAELYKLVNEVSGDVDAGVLMDSVVNSSLAQDGTA